MTLSTFCDIVWMEIWDDCSAMGDQSQYREIVTKLFIEGVPTWDITFDGYDDKGKKIKKRLAPKPPGAGTGVTPADAIARARSLAEKLKGGRLADTKAFVKAVNVAKEAAQVASPPSG